MTEKLNWQYNDRSGEQFAMYQGFRIRAVQDQDSSNPFEDSDGNLPLCVRSPDGYRSTSFRNYDKVCGAQLQDAMVWLTDAQIVHDQRAITEALGYKSVFDCVANNNDEDARTKAGEPRKYFRDADVLRAAFEAALEDVSDSDRLETCAKLYTIAGIPNLCTTSRGYSQGDWAELLVVALPTVVAKWGIPEDAITEAMQGAADLWGAWAWGDVYGYIAERRVPGDDDDDADWEQVDSCWGYYGSDHGDSGLEESAIDAIDCRIRCAHKARLDKLKDLLRNHVPLAKREELLRDAYLGELADA